jgi:hypothetical protein
MKPIKAASMLAMMAFSPFFIIFMQVPLPPLLVSQNSASLSLSMAGLSLQDLKDTALCAQLFCKIP